MFSGFFDPNIIDPSTKRRRRLSVAKMKETSHFYRYCFQGGLTLVAKTRNKEGGIIELWYCMDFGTARNQKALSCQKERNFPLLPVLFPGRTNLDCQNAKQRRRQHRTFGMDCWSDPKGKEAESSQLPKGKKLPIATGIVSREDSS